MKQFTETCLNYENKRNRPDADPAKKRRQQVKNFKLKFSRMLTCFGTVVALCAKTQPVDPSMVLSVLNSPPIDRLLSVVDSDKELKKYLPPLSTDTLGFLKKPP
jgi:hypothetical protein